MFTLFNFLSHNGPLTPGKCSGESWIPFKCLSFIESLCHERGLAEILQISEKLDGIMKLSVSVNEMCCKYCQAQGHISQLSTVNYYEVYEQAKICNKDRTKSICLHLFSA